MRICRYRERGGVEPRLGLVDAEGVRDATEALAALGPFHLPLPTHDPFIAALPKLRPVLADTAGRSSARALDDIELLSPVANPGKILAAPVNYRRHLEEAREDPEIHHQNRVEEIRRVGLFLKATSSLVGPSEGVRLRHEDRRNDHEIELVTVIGWPASNVTAEDALSYVAGYAVGLDMTVRGPEERSLRKSIDSYSVVGPWMVTADEVSDPGALNLLLSVNGEERQRANTKDLIIGVAELISFASSFYTLMPGDLLFTGTPEGVGPVVAGDVIAAEIGGIGTMQVRVSSARGQDGEHRDGV